MKPTYRRPGRVWRKMTVLVLTLLWLSSTIALTGCSARNLVVVRGSEKIEVTKELIDQLYSDNERLIKALTDCRQK